MKKLLVCLAVTLLVTQAVLVPMANAQGGETKKEEVQPKPEHDPMLALLFGLIIPGGTQFYNGATDEAIKVFAICAGTWLAVGCIATIITVATGGIGSLLWLIVWPVPIGLQVWYAYQGYLEAQKIQAGTAMHSYPMETTLLTTK